VASLCGKGGRDERGRSAGRGEPREYWAAPSKLVGCKERGGEERWVEDVVYRNEVTTAREKTDRTQTLGVNDFPIRQSNSASVWFQAHEGAAITHRRTGGAFFAERKS